MKKILITLTLLIIILCVNAYSQPSLKGTPYSFNSTEISDYFDHIVLPPPATLDQIIADDELRDKSGHFYRIATSVYANINTLNYGTWEKLSNGDSLWRIKITLTGALATGIYYNQFKLAPGARLFLYNETKTKIIGAFSSANNPKSDYFATEYIPGETVILELYEPSGSTVKSFISISEIAYFYRGIKTEEENKEYGDSEACQININCSEGNAWQDEKTGVCRIAIKAGMDYGWCSGSLINNIREDCTPYLLTADHCGEGSSASDRNQWIFYFNYEAPTCTYTGGEPTSNTITGCTLKANGGNGGDDGSDFYLIELNTAPGFNPYFNGWDRNNTPAASGVSIHHPAGDIQKISTYTSSLSSESWGGTVPDTHWEVTWASTSNGHGVTEGGSSGSPIFNNSGNIVGDLTGGSSFCSTPTNPDFYGKFSYSWDQNGSTAAERLKDWLDPDNTGAFSLNGAYCGQASTLTANFSANQTSISVGGTVNFTDLSIGSPTSWSWTFSGGTPASSTNQNPTGIQYNTAGAYPVSLTVDDGTNNDTETKNNYILVGMAPPAPSEGDCDTLRYPLPGTLVVYSVRLPGGQYNYFSGNSDRGDLAKADYFVPDGNFTEVSGAYIKFGHATKRVSENPDVIFAIWDNNGPGNTPGAVPLATDTIPLGTIVTHVNGHQWTKITFKDTVSVTTPYYVGVYLPTAIGDTLALLTNKNGESIPGTAWEQLQDGTWQAYSELTSCGYEVSQAIFPTVCRSDMGIENYEQQMLTFVYPNPAKDFINIDFINRQFEKLKFQIINPVGEIISELTYSGQSSSSFKINVQNLNSGIYFLRIETDEIISTQRVIILR